MTRTVEYIYFETQRPILRCGRSPYNVIRKVSFHVSIHCKYIIIYKVVKCRLRVQKKYNNCTLTYCSSRFIYTLIFLVYFFL